MIRRRFLAMAATAVLTMGLDPFWFGGESGGGEPAWSSIRELAKHSQPGLTDGGFLVPTEYAEEIAARLNAAAVEYFEQDLERQAEQLVWGTGHGTPKGLLHG